MYLTDMFSLNCLKKYMCGNVIYATIQKNGYLISTFFSMKKPESDTKSITRYKKARNYNFVQRLASLCHCLMVES